MTKRMYNKTTLIYACEYEYYDIIEYLIDHDINMLTCHF